MTTLAKMSPKAYEKADKYVDKKQVVKEGSKKDNKLDAKKIKKK